MRTCLILLRRELGSYFVSWTGYIVISVVLFLIGLGFVGLIESLNVEPITSSVVELFFESYNFWLILVLVVPLITMRIFARDKSSGTIETLITTPITDVQIVAAKFFGALAFYAIMWLPLLLCIFVVQYYMPADIKMDYGKILSAYLGVILIGVLFIAAGCFASVLSKNQISAAIIGLAFAVFLFTLGYLSYSAPFQNGVISEILSYMNLIEHIRDFARGVIDTRPVVFYISSAALFLNFTLRTIQNHQWR
ncbi:MAG TPA: ABC transporter permease subunit [Verrucomicrobiota bacterium]|nr:ABC transporter permease subunit [Verrucomicrobiota bacterium]